MFQVNSSQFNYLYRNRIHFPYSIGMLIAYLKNKEQINQNFKFEKTFVFRDKINEYINQCKNSDILLCSCYVWNWEITTHLAREVKKINPNCLIIFGGPHVPNRANGFFEKYSFVDIIVHGEGEYTLLNIFEAYLAKRDYSNIKGIETKNFKTQPQPRLDDLSTLQSPYLTNLMWQLVEKIDGIQWVAAWETLRGCPYRCTFCDWGSATATKMRKFQDDKIMKEIDWFAENKIPYIDCCDANFGIYQERDMRIAQKLKEVALKTGYPETFHPTFAKFSSEKIIPIAKELQDAGLLRAVTLALQSLDERTLQIIKRENIKFDKFSELTETFRKAGIPTYTEIILGLPGETLESFKIGLETIVSDTKIGSIYIYNCGLFPNAPMAEPEYVNKYEIKTIRSPIFLQHSDVKNRGIQEYEDLVVSSFSYTIDDIKEMYLYAWCVQTFESLGILEYISKYYHKIHDLKFMKFYDIFLNYCRTNESLFSQEYQKVIEHINKGYAGKGWNHYDPELGEIYWPIEEATWARLAWNDKKLMDEIDKFLTYFEKTQNYKTPTKILTDLVKWNVFLLTTRNNIDDIKSAEFDFNWKNFFVNNHELKNVKKRYFYKNLITEKDPIMWTWKTIFFGRPSKKYKFHPEFLNEEQSEILVETKIISK